jgi:hypothetical protein
MANVLPIENPNIQKYIFECKICNFLSCNKKDYNRHLMTRKHNILVNANNFTPKTPINVFKCDCGKEYKHEPSLYKHKNKCQYNQLSTIIPVDQNSLTAKLIELVMSKNQDFITELVSNMTQSNKDVMEKMMELMPKLGNNSHNNITNNNTTNNQFNIQMFLNEHCKNAMNLTDFIDSLPITAATYDSTIENGLTKTLTNMITNGLSQLDILERPIHCTDATRKILYVKEANNWEKDTELLKILLGIKQLARKQRTMISEWKDVNEGWEKDDNIQTKLTTLICHSMTDIENDQKETSKIIRAISKNVYLDNEAKQQYIK